MQQIVNPTDNEIATVAYQLWLDSGCPGGSDQEHWFRAESLLRKKFIATCEDRPGRPWIPRCGARAEPEAFTLERWEGHWEVWEREWGGARWVWDVRDSGVRVSNRAG
jgi:hypothetical protein